MVANITEDTAVTADKFENFKLFAQYSAAAYCDVNNDSRLGNISCTTNQASACPSVESAAAETVLEFRNNADDTRGYIAADHTNSQVVLAFRGSQSIQNWVTNFKPGLINSNLCAGCKLHKGFSTAWEGVQQDIISVIKNMKQKYPSYKFIVTGHSLGGALATIAGAHLRKVENIPCDIYTYGSPRVGNDKFAELVSETVLGDTARITHLNDVVPLVPGPRLPIPRFYGYQHTSPEYWLFTGEATTTSYTRDDIKVCHGTDTNKCSGSFRFDRVQLLKGIEAHGYYFVKLGSCAARQGKDAGQDERWSDAELQALEKQLEDYMQRDN
ncbi:lipase family protein [Aspergillus tanneri]|uniref:feruloyl esterase n=1 Tax=Aspergillus tanneri TaxID=1220188 RepID=A0A5M9ND89_9EURO|nr:uncharacterized protein ATNIH1004_001552 [Aspergillus tanneri]KAA8652647.1 hypothetical protein ATNIH1004_001552 [Aspergillus tanneri]